MDLFNPLLITLLPTGLIFVFAGWIMLKKAPKGINSTYGHRTSRSMKNPENWKIAQEYSAKEMIRIGWTLTLVGILGTLLGVSDAVGILVSMVLIVGSAIWIIYKTEKMLMDND